MARPMRIRRRSAAALAMVLAAGVWPLQARAQGTWTPTGAMAVARTQHAASGLADGRVLVAGGITTGGSTTASAEIYDAGSASWTVTGAMITPRSRHTATLLRDGRLLVTGGRFRDVSVAYAEIYDPASGSWSGAAAMHVPRDNHAATLLLDGRVLVTGGVSGGDGGGPVEKTAEIYDPLSGTWSIADHLSSARYNHQATRLADGRVLVSGGFNVGANHVPVKSAEIYDPAADRWSQAPNMDTPRATHLAILLDDGRVLVGGGWTQPPNAITLTASTEIYDPAADAWTTGASLPAARGSLVNHAVALADGGILAPGGRLDSGTTATAVRYSPVTGLWTGTGSMGAARSGGTAVSLPDGRVLMTGGGNAGGILSSAEIYWP